MDITSCEDSPAGWPLQGRKWLFVFAGACLQAISAGQRASPPAKIRQQAGSYKERKWLFLFVGACLQAKRAGQRTSPPAKIRQQAVYRGALPLSLWACRPGPAALKNPQCKCLGLRPPPWPPLPEPPRPRGGRPSCMELTSSLKRFSNSWSMAAITPPSSVLSKCRSSKPMAS